MNPRPRDPCGADWVERYERLRQHALDKPASLLWGLDALLQNGVAVWMRAMPTNDTGREETATASVAADWLETNQRETTLLLAEMTLPQLSK